MNKVEIRPGIYSVGAVDWNDEKLFTDIPQTEEPHIMHI